MSCGRPSDQKLFAGYIMGVRGTASSGAIRIPPENHLQAYLELRVVVWLIVEGLGLIGEAVRLLGQPPQCQFLATRWTLVLPWVISGVSR